MKLIMHVAVSFEAFLKNEYFKGYNHDHIFNKLRKNCKHTV